MLMLNKTPAAVTNSVIALLPVWRANRSTGSFPDDFVEPGKWFRRGLAGVAAQREAASRFGSDIRRRPLMPRQLKFLWPSMWPERKSLETALFKYLA